MVTVFFSLGALVSQTSIEIGLLVGSLLLVTGLLLLLIPRQEQRSSKPNLRSQSRMPNGALPGRRILREEARVSRRWLSVPRITILNPQQKDQPPSSPTSATTIKEASGAVVESSANAAASPLVISSPPSLSGQPTVQQDMPSSQPSNPSTEAPALDAQYDVPTLLALQPGELITVAPPETARERVEHEPHAGFWRTEEDTEPGQVEDAALAAASEAVASIVERETPPAEPTPIRKARLSGILAETRPGEQLSREQITPTQDMPPHPSAPTHLVRRAQLTGFPPPISHAADAPPQATPPEEAVDQLISLATRQQDDEAEAAPGVQGNITADSRTEESAALVSAVAVPPVASSENKASPLVAVICFGTVDILVGGKSLSPLESRFRSSREFELMTFLAHWAVTRRGAFVDRGTITEALLAEELSDPDDEDVADLEEREGVGGFQRSPLGGWKYRLCRRLRQMGVLDQVWLEARADGALRLRPEVRIDLIEFLQVASQLRKERDQLRYPDRKPVSHETILGWLHQLQCLYRDRGEFAEQFLLCEWTQEPRRRYRSLYWHALWHAAELLAASGERQRAIQVAEELIESNEVEVEPIFESLLTWLSEEGNKPDLLKWLNRYREWYAETYPGQSPDIARADLMKQLAKASKSPGS